MSFPEIITMLVSWIHSPAGITAAAFVGSWLSGKAIVVLLKMPITRRILSFGLKSAGAPAVVVGKWFQVGPLHLISGPIVCLMVFAGFWFFSFMDRLLTYLKPETLEMVEALEKMLEESGSTDRKLYIQSKQMTGPQVKAVSQMAEAVAAGPAQLGSNQLRILDQAQAIGSDLQQSRLEAKD